MPQLRKFLYLDEDALSDYLSVLEDGLRQRREMNESSGSSKAGGVDLRIANAGAQAQDGQAATTEFTDSAPARFERLVNLASADEDSTGWAELSTLDELETVGRGALVHFECEAYIPDLIKALGGDDLEEAMQMLDVFAPMADTLGLDMTGLPDADQLRGVRAAAGALAADLVFVGADDESDWKVAGKLRKGWLRDPEIDEFVRVVGKVATSWKRGTWKPLMALPGASLLPRDERRKLERRKPEKDDGTTLEGPAVMIDVLAIYR